MDGTLAVSLSSAGECKHGTFGVKTIDDPAAAGDFHRAVYHLATRLNDACGCTLDAVHPKVHKPCRPNKCGIGHEAAKVTAFDAEQLIHAHGPHVHGAGIAPTKLRRVER